MVAVRLVVQWGCTVSQLKGTTRGEKVLEDARALLLLRGDEAAESYPSSSSSSSQCGSLLCSLFC